MSPARSKRQWVAFGVAAGLLLTAAVAFGTIVRVYGIMLRKEAIYPADNRLLTSLPAQTRSWTREGVDRKESAEVEATLGTTNYVSRFMRRKDGSALLDMHLAYYTGQIDTVPHVPDRCFVGGGMQIGKVVGDISLSLDRTNWREASDVPEGQRGKVFTYRLDDAYSAKPGSFVTLPRDPGAITMRVMQFLTKEGREFYSGYFFIANGSHVSRAEGVRLLAFDLKTRSAYYCKVQFTSAPGMDQEAFLEQVTSLLSESIGEIMLCVPDWRVVEEADARARGQ